MNCITKAMRAKYAASLNDSLTRRRPAGAYDINRLCDLAEALEAIARKAQHQLPVDQQNEIERLLFAAETRP